MHSDVECNSYDNGDVNNNTVSKLEKKIKH